MMETWISQIQPEQLLRLMLTYMRYVDMQRQASDRVRYADGFGYLALLGPLSFIEVAL